MCISMARRLVVEILYTFCIMIAILSVSSYIENILSFLGILSHAYSLMHGSVCIVKQLPAVLVCILNRKSIQRVVTYSISICHQAYFLGWSARNELLPRQSKVQIDLLCTYLGCSSDDKRLKHVALVCVGGSGCSPEY